jgi:putative DNA primase/helicase
MIKIWEAGRAMLAPTARIDVSGHLTLVQDNGQRCVEWMGIDQIKQHFKAPTLMLDATLPDKSILRAYHPTVEVVADLRVAMPPSVRVRQVLGAPTSANKLKDEKHLAEVRRYILQRWIESGRGATLVICQKAAEQWLAQSNLPSVIALAHYNDIAGLDDYRDVRLLILVGRTQPGPSTPETITAALTGRRPAGITVRRGGAFAWYPQVKRGIRLADGGARAVKGDQHPDPLVEAVRWQICEAQLLQAIGRGRAINRTAETPLDIDLLFDTVLPITIDDDVRWKTPSLLAVTAADGYMPTAPVDMTKLRPELWANEKAAYRCIKHGVPKLPGFVAITYQLKGPKMNQRVAYFDQQVIPDPRAWLEQRLGALA